MGLADITHLIVYLIADFLGGAAAAFLFNALDMGGDKTASLSKCPRFDFCRPIAFRSARYRSGSLRACKSSRRNLLDGVFSSATQSTDEFDRAMMDRPWNWLERPRPSARCPWAVHRP